MRRTFARAAGGDPEFARIMQTVREALLDRLDGIRIAPSRILDLGAGTCEIARALTRRFRGVDVVCVDPVVSLLRTSRSRELRWFSRHRHVAAEAERLPLAPNSVDLILSNVAMPWFDPIDDALAECRRTLRPGGLFLLSTLGPDTLKELALAWRNPVEVPRTYPFADMHVLGDALMHAGFVDVVMDVHRALYRVPDFWRLCRILSRSGGSPAFARRRRGLAGVSAFRSAAARYASLRQPDGSLPVTVEFVFGHAWAPDSARQRSRGVYPRMDWTGRSEPL